MRIRTIKPEFWQSADIHVLPVEDRLLFIGLWSYVDDNGVGRDQPIAITTDLFAGDFVASPAETLARVTGGLQHLAAHGRITRYTVEGTQYLAITNWKRHQRIDRPNKPRLPEPDHPEAVPTRDNAESGADPREGSARDAETLASVSETLPVRNRGTGEQGNRGTGEQGAGDPSLRSGGAGAVEPDQLPALRVVHSAAEAAPTQPEPKPKRGTRIPEGWMPDRTDANINAEKALTTDQLRLQLDQFRDYWTAKTGAGATKLDWNATWRNWVRTAAERTPAQRPKGRASDLTNADWDARMAEAVERDRQKGLLP